MSQLRAGCGEKSHGGNGRAGEGSGERLQEEGQRRPQCEGGRGKDSTHTFLQPLPDVSRCVKLSRIIFFLLFRLRKTKSSHTCPAPPSPTPPPWRPPYGRNGPVLAGHQWGSAERLPPPPSPQAPSLAAPQVCRSLSPDMEPLQGSPRWPSVLTLCSMREGSSCVILPTLHGGTVPEVTFKVAPRVGEQTAHPNGHKSLRPWRQARLGTQPTCSLSRDTCSQPGLLAEAQLCRGAQRGHPLPLGPEQNCWECRAAGPVGRCPSRPITAACTCPAPLTRPRYLLQDAAAGPLEPRWPFLFSPTVGSLHHLRSDLGISNRCL